MTSSKPKVFPEPKSPAVVAAICSRADLKTALSMEPSHADLFELRLDALALDLSILRKELPRLRLPLLLTARHPAEGGQHQLSRNARQELLLEFLPWAALVDVEVRSLHEMTRLLSELRRRKVGLVASFHDFHKTPTPGILLRKAARARDYRAAIFKAATRAESLSDVRRLLETAEKIEGLRFSLMGMGPMGAYSRLALALAGSALNYAHLGRSGVPGQWPARDFKSVLASAGKITGG